MGRLLEDDEHVDHIDGNNANDSLDNLQILKAGDHKRKSSAEAAKRSKCLMLHCPVCGSLFMCQRHRRALTDAPCCSQKCAKTYKWRNQYGHGGVVAEGEGVEPSRAY